MKGKNYVDYLWKLTSFHFPFFTSFQMADNNVVTQQVAPDDVFMIKNIKLLVFKN